METVTYKELKRLAKANQQPIKRLAVVGDCATQQLAVALSGESMRRDFPLAVYDADYDQLEALLLDGDSELYAFHPDYILIVCCTQKLQLRFEDTPLSERETFAERELERFCGLWTRIAANSSAKIIMFDFPEPDDSVFGSFGYRTPISFAYQCRKLNMLLGEAMAREYPNAYPAALSRIQRQLGSSEFADARMWYLAKMSMQTETLPYAAELVLDIVLATQGRIKKCVITDLDNTLWGGVIGDDGIDGIQLGELGTGPAFSALQRYLKALRERGILLAVCSKNHEETAKEPFLHHPDMVLRMEDIAIFVANWENKAQNIRYIQETLNIGMDSLVFLDDNPFERNLVKGLLPEVTVPELPEDPALVPEFLEGLHLFEAAGYSDEDSGRTAQYRAEANRRAVQSTYADYDAYLTALEMRAAIMPFDPFHYARIAQLTQRSNQFNLRTIRYTESEIEALAANPRYVTRYMTLSDRFGDHGLISVVILKKQEDAMFIDTWLMSCRVLRRGVEQCLFDAIVALTLEQGYTRLRAEYLPTAKNKMVEHFYDECGMTPIGDGQYELDCTGYPMHQTKITQEI